jgi:hypothetical protein
MPYVVNGQLVTEDVVRAQEVQLQRDPQWQRIADQLERAERLRTAAQFAAIDVTLFEQTAANDPRPIDPGAVERELQRLRAMGSCRNASDENGMRQVLERHFRLQLLGLRGRAPAFGTLLSRA